MWELSGVLLSWDDLISWDERVSCQLRWGSQLISWDEGASWSAELRVSWDEGVSWSAEMRESADQLRWGSQLISWLPPSSQTSLIWTVWAHFISISFSTNQINVSKDSGPTEFQGRYLIFPYFSAISYIQCMNNCWHYVHTVVDSEIDEIPSAFQSIKPEDSNLLFNVTNFHREETADNFYIFSPIYPEKCYIVARGHREAIISSGRTRIGVWKYPR
jgi:hypothetical protein